MFLFDLLLYEIKKIREHNTPNKDRDYPISHQILNYINQHLFDDISLDNLAKKFFISKTTLIRIIKNSTGSTPWNYITIKRLNCAKTMLENGHSPNEVCFSCGYKDYSSFFRAYKNHFGKSPSDTSGISYNTKEDIDTFIAALKKAIMMLE